MKTYTSIPSTGVPIKAWVDGVDLAENATRQLQNTARLKIIHSHLAVMPDVHLGMGATIGTVIPTIGAIVPAAVGVDLGCGMCAVRTTLTASDLPENLREVRSNIERAVPHGRTSGRRGKGRDKGSWQNVPNHVGRAWEATLSSRFDHLCETSPKLKNTNNLSHLGTLGTGNHFVEVCLDLEERVWFVLHSGSRGVGNRIATIFIEKAKKELEHELGSLPDVDLAYLTEGTEHFAAYIEAVEWAQDFAAVNRRVMMEAVIEAVAQAKGIKKFAIEGEWVNCHHNYVERELHFGKECWVTRKGAVKAGDGDIGIIPGSMGAKSFIVRGKGNAESFHSCSHGAGRAMSRTAAKKRYTVEDHKRATAHVECRKDESVIDETPMAYKDIDAVMAAQAELVDIVHTLSQVVCVKG